MFNEIKDELENISREPGITKTDTDGLQQELSMSARNGKHKDQNQNPVAKLGKRE